jgi:hypothetical protein
MQPFDYFRSSNEGLESLNKTFRSLREQDRRDLEEARRNRLTEVQAQTGEFKLNQAKEEAARRKAGLADIQRIANLEEKTPTSTTTLDVMNQEPGAEPFTAPMTATVPAVKYTQQEKSKMMLESAIKNGQWDVVKNLGTITDVSSKINEQEGKSLSDWAVAVGNFRKNVKDPKAVQQFAEALASKYGIDPKMVGKIDWTANGDVTKDDGQGGKIVGVLDPMSGTYHWVHVAAKNEEAYKIGHVQEFKKDDGTTIYREYQGKNQWKERPDLGGNAPSKGFDTMEEAAAEAKKMHEATGKNPAQMPNIEIGAGNKYYPKVITNPTEVGKSRTEGYGNIRQVTVLDTQNDNQLVTMTANDFANSRKEEPGRFVDAAKAKNALTQTALLQDIHGAIKNSKGSVDRLKNDFDETSRLLLYKAVQSQNPTGAINNFIGGQFGKALTPDQVDYLTDLGQLIENAMAMRSVLGAGQGSDQLRDAIKATIPNKGTFSKEYAKDQLRKFEQQVNRLERGVPGVKLATPKGEIETPPKEVKYSEGNDSWTIPAEKEAAFLKAHPKAKKVQ